MMGSVSSKTSWASCKHGIINFDKMLHLVGYFFMNQPIFVKSHGYTIAINVCQWYFLMNKKSNILNASNLCVYGNMVIDHVANTELLPVAFLFSNVAMWEWERRGNKATEMRKRTKLRNNAIQIQPFKPQLARNFNIQQIMKAGRCTVWIIWYQNRAQRTSFLQDVYNFWKSFVTIPNKTSLQN
jgi:hypothetical protein